MWIAGTQFSHQQRIESNLDVALTVSKLPWIKSRGTNVFVYTGLYSIHNLLSFSATQLSWHQQDCLWSESDVPPQASMPIYQKHTLQESTVIHSTCKEAGREWRNITVVFVVLLTLLALWCVRYQRAPSLMPLFSLHIYSSYTPSSHSCTFILMQCKSQGGSMVSCSHTAIKRSMSFTSQHWGWLMISSFCHN